MPIQDVAHLNGRDCDHRGSCLSLFGMPLHCTVASEIVARDSSSSMLSGTRLASAATDHRGAAAPYQRGRLLPVTESARRVSRGVAHASCNGAPRPIVTAATRYVHPQRGTRRVCDVHAPA